MTEFNFTAVLFAVFGVLLVTSVALSRGLERAGVPVALLFLLLGMLGGSEGIGGIWFDDHQLAFRVGTLALVLILFDGGLNTKVAAIRRSIRPAIVLATVGVLLTAGLVALAGRLVGLTWPESMLLGAIVSSTDAATVFAVLRGSRLALQKRVGTTLELESGLNDPMAVLLTIGVTSALAGGDGLGIELLWQVPLQLVVGAAVGGVMGFVGQGLLTRLKVTAGGLFPVATLGLAMLAFGAATAAQGSGFLAVYVAAVVIGNSEIPYRASLARIHDAIAWLSQVAMFVMLGLLVFPSRLVPVAGAGLAVALLLAFVARPLAVFLCLLPFRYPWRETTYIGWVGLRGAVPIVLATYPVLAGVEGATKVFDVVFFVVVVNALVPGATVRHATRLLKLEDPSKPPPAAVLEVASTTMLRGELMSFRIGDDLVVCDAAISDVPFPDGASIALVVRGDELLAARGSTVLREGDHVYVFCRRGDRGLISLLFGRPEE
jgi:cell volume regulation protein A